MIRRTQDSGASHYFAMLFTTARVRLRVEPKYRYTNVVTHVAKGAFMSLLSLAHSSADRPWRRSPGKPSRLTILSRCGGTMEMQRWKRP